MTCNFSVKDDCYTDECLFYTKYYMWTPWVLIPAAFAYFLVRLVGLSIGKPPFYPEEKLSSR